MYIYIIEVKLLKKEMTIKVYRSQKNLNNIRKQFYLVSPLHTFVNILF